MATPKRTGSATKSYNSNVLIEEDVDTEKEELKKKYAELEEKLNRLLSMQQPQTIVYQQPPVVQEDSERLNSDTHIPIMSLKFDNLTLSTKEIGKGTINFNKFGQMKQVTYAELIRIMELHPTFLEKGYFYILDKRVIEKHNLNEIYSSILDKNQIDVILSGNKEVAIKLYRQAHPNQQEVINDELVRRIIKDEEYDLNMVEEFSKISKTNILDRVKSSREYMAIEDESTK